MALIHWKLVGKIYQKPDHGGFLLLVDHPLGGEKIRAPIEHDEFLKFIDDHWENND